MTARESNALAAGISMGFFIALLMIAIFKH